MDPGPSNKKPRGILKNSTSFENAHKEAQAKRRGEMKWDENNILETYHPANKDYGHMKITDPPTPFHYGEEDQVDPQALANKLTNLQDKPPLKNSDSSDDDLTDEAKAERKRFEQKRKMHYNEFQAVRLARQLMQEDEEEEEELNRQSAATSKNPPKKNTNNSAAPSAGSPTLEASGGGDPLDQVTAMEVDSGCNPQD